MKYIRPLLIISLSLLIGISVVYALCYDCGSCGYGCDDAYTSYFDQWPGLYHEGNGYYDGIVWGSKYLDVGLDGEDHTVMVECFDWADDGDFEQCQASSGQALSDCRDASSVLDNMCNGGTACYGSGAGDYHQINTGDDGDHWSLYVTIQYYHDCDDPSYDWYRVRAPYYVIYQHQYDCDSDPGPSTNPDYEGNYDSWWDIKANNGMCLGTEECDENHDQDVSTIFNEVIDTPCRTKDGYSCSVDDDCISDDCDGNHWGYIHDCDTDGDGATDYDRYDRDYDNACGGNGIRDPGDDEDNHLSCVNDYGSGHVCDEYDPQEGIEYTSIQKICNKQLGETCSANSDCWHYDKGSGTTYCNYGGSASKHCIYSCYEDSACTGDYNDCKTTDCGTANQYCYYCVCTDYGGCDSCLDWSNGHSCDCDGECQSGNCASGTCYPATETSCTDSSDNDMDGSTDCDDSDCEGQTGPNGKICCNDGAYDCGTCKYCSNDECENRPTTYECNSNYKCSNSAKGDNAYDASDYKSPSKGYCDGNGNCDYVPNDAPTCDVAEGGNQEGDNYDICQDGYSSCRDTCSDGIDNDNDGYTDGADSGCTGGNCNYNGICDQGETTSSCSSDCKSIGSSCSYDAHCYSGICICNVCRGSYTYYDDSCCSTALGETCSNSDDCGSCSPLISVPLEIVFEVS